MVMMTILDIVFIFITFTICSEWSCWGGGVCHWAFSLKKNTKWQRNECGHDKKNLEQ